MSRTSSVAIVMHWAATIADAAVGGYRAADEATATDIHPALAVAVILMPLVFMPILALRAESGPFRVSVLVRAIDARAGDGAYDGFCVRLKPILMLSAGATTLCLVALVRSAFVGAPAGFYAGVAFLGSCAVALVLLHTALRRRLVPGV